MNAQFHLFQDLTNPFTAVIVSEKTNRTILEMIDIPEIIEVHEMTVEMNLQL